jgi:hydrogenase expression/formation protein HypE
MTALPVGKLDPALLRDLLASAAKPDPRVILGPGIGRDVAVLDFGDTALVVKSDPVTLATEDLGWYAVNVNANDIATAGARPRWFLGTLLLPEGRADEELAARIFAQIRKACETLDISLVGGHTEVTYGLERPVICGQMLGEVPPGKLVLPTGLRIGDAVLMTKTVAIEGTSVLAREAGERLMQEGCTREDIAAGAACLYDPGISVLAESEALTSAVTVHAMHDPTEGGIATGLWEMAEAGGVGVDVETGRIPIHPLCRWFSALLGLDPLGLIASGALLAAVGQADVPRAVEACAQRRIRCTAIGTVTPRAGGVRELGPDGWRPLRRFDQDELAKVFAREGP